ncbi:heparinase II/III family protein [Paenibacillus senegalensis]|uniref:heparinase II/III family protein n=1 Tax=Paenibacillus senegalensis TaxID=1465766 RepID=UPI000287AD4D|nr:heparinase II/III family protein [Paenibacillus senegalensis]
MLGKKLWQPPEGIKPDLTLEHPRVLYTAAQLQKARNRVGQEGPSWARRAFARIMKQANALRWMSLDDEEIRGLVPERGAYYMYGVTNPVGPDGTRIVPIGWSAPGQVRSELGAVYPSEQYPDDGTGWQDADGQIYYFTARWHGFVVDELTRAVEPLAYAYAISGEAVYARKAAVILDALAAVYPEAIEGPLDYPGLRPGKEGGRLERPYYQVARTLIWYTNACDLIWRSGELDGPSKSNPGCTIKENIVYNLLLNGADYCYRESQLPGYVDQLHNGTADYNMGIAVVGSLLGIDRYVDWAVNGPTNLRFMISNNIDRDGNYFETSESYSRVSQEIYLHMAEALYHVRTPQFAEGINFYQDERFVRFYVGNRRKNMLAGRIPSYGDSFVDEKVDADEGFDKAAWYHALKFYLRTSEEKSKQDYVKWLRLPPGVTLDEIAEGDKSIWLLFNLEDEEQFVYKPDSPSAESQAAQLPALLGGKGLLYLRAGKGAHQRGAFLRYGPTLNHGQLDELAILLYASGRELTFDPGYNMAQYRYGWQFETVSHWTVAVNETGQLSSSSAGGSVHFFAHAPGLCVADVSDEAAYRSEGVEIYRRMLAMIDISDTESYWVDLFRVSGGRVRDYSFHSRGKVFSSEGLTLSPPEKGSVASTEYDWGRQLKGDGTVSGFEKEGFSFSPPGRGYGFLGRPRRALASDVWSSTWSDPAQLKLTMLPQEGREVIVAEGPEPMGVTYVLARDKGPATSQFMAIIEAGEKAGAARIKALDLEAAAQTQIAKVKPAVAAIAHTPAGKHSFCDYILSTLDGCSFSALETSCGGRKVETNAEFAMVRLREDHHLLQAHFVRGTSLRIGEMELSIATSSLAGIIQSVNYELGTMTILGMEVLPEALRGQYIYVDSPEYSHNSPYFVNSAQQLSGDCLLIEAGAGKDGFTLARGRLTQKPQENRLPNGVNLPYSRNVLRHGPNCYFDGKLVANHAGANALITAVDADYAGLHVNTISGFAAGDNITIYDIKAGDQVVLPLSVHLQWSGENDYELRSIVPVQVAGADCPIYILGAEGEWIAVKRQMVNGRILSIIEPGAEGRRTIRFGQRANG